MKKGKEDLSKIKDNSRQTPRSEKKNREEKEGHGTKRKSNS